MSERAKPSASSFSLGSTVVAIDRFPEPAQKCPAVLYIFGPFRSQLHEEQIFDGCDHYGFACDLFWLCALDDRLLGRKSSKDYINADFARTCRRKHPSSAYKPGRVFRQ